MWEKGRLVELLERTGSLTGLALGAVAAVTPALLEDMLKLKLQFRGS